MTTTLSFNESLKKSILVAQAFAKEYKNERFSSAHLLRGLLHEEVGLTHFLKSIDKDVNYIIDWAEVRIDDYPKSGKTIETPAGDDKAANILEEADTIRVKLGLDEISPICVLTALAKPNIGFTPDQLKSFPIKEREILDIYLKDSPLEKDVLNSNGGSGLKTSGSGSALHKYCIDKTSLAREGKVDPIIGRDKETRMMIEILGRRTKPNVIVIGDPGVGKTALAEGLALQIIQGHVPDNLKSSLLFQLDLGALAAGASYKGEVEDRLKNIIKEIKQLDKAILFIDEIHSLLDPKGQSGNGIANLLKPELAQGKITVIGTSTSDEYRKIIEPDQAFNRRFEVLRVEEPDMTSTIKMVNTLLPIYEAHHKIKVAADAIPECVRLAKRYIKDRRLPDSAIDLLDRTMAAIKMMDETSRRELETLKEALEQVRSNTSETAELLHELKWFYSLLKNKLSPVLLGKLEDNTNTEEIESAAALSEHISQVLNNLLEITKAKKEEVSKHDIAAVVSYKTGIPLGKIQAQEKEKLLQMETYLKHRVVGQDHALKSLAAAVLESRSGLNKPGQPIGSFFFLGPTGTGKTELTKTIAEFLFNDEKSMIRFDMSEFKEEHSAALLYGAPPGYVGYEEGGMLVNKIRQQPYSVVLFDEIEKAHPSVFDIFLQILDEGKMHDRLGKEGDFSNSIIIFTSNIGSEWIVEQFNRHEIPKSNQLMEIMSRHFRPEFLARLTEIIPFAPISEQNVVKILEYQMRTLLDTLNKQGIILEITEDAKKTLAMTGFTPKYGARQLAGVVRNHLRRPLSRMIISGEVKKGSNIQVNLNPEGEIEWKTFPEINA